MALPPEKSSQSSWDIRASTLSAFARLGAPNSIIRRVPFIIPPAWVIQLGRSFPPMLVPFSHCLAHITFLQLRGLGLFRLSTSKLPTWLSAGALAATTGLRLRANLDFNTTTKKSMKLCGRRSSLS